jgi:hypothetical protein
MRILLASVVLLGLSTAGLAQPTANIASVKAPEALLSAECIAYFRYDGYEPHRKAYDETALAKAMKEGLSDFLDHVLQQLPTLAGGDMLRGNPKKGERPALSLEDFLACLSKNGFVLALEVDEKAERG